MDSNISDRRKLKPKNQCEIKKFFTKVGDSSSPGILPMPIKEESSINFDTIQYNETTTWTAIGASATSQSLRSNSTAATENSNCSSESNASNSSLQLEQGNSSKSCPDLTEPESNDTGVVVCSELIDLLSLRPLWNFLHTAHIHQFNE